MATHKNRINIDVQGVQKFAEALKSLGDSGVFAATAMQALGGVAQRVAKDAKLMIASNPSGETFVSVDGRVSREEFKTLAEKYARASQRLTMLLSLLSAEELKRMGLIDPNESVTDIDGWDRVFVLKALDARVELFNAAHKRLTGKKNAIPETGKLELDTAEMALVMEARSAGKNTQQILKMIEARRAGKP